MQLLAVGKLSVVRERLLPDSPMLGQVLLRPPAAEPSGSDVGDLGEDVVEDSLEVESAVAG